MQYDVIVIGAGNGGLSAAASACTRGLKTLLIEQHDLPGRSRALSDLTPEIFPE